MPIGQAASFDVGLVKDIAAMVAAEAQYKVASAYKASQVLDGSACFAPNVNLLRVGGWVVEWVHHVGGWISG